MIISYIKKLINNSNDYKFREIKVYGEKINYIYNEVLTNSSLINDLILKYVVKLNKKELKNINNYIPNCSSLIIKKKDILNYLNNGYLIIYYKKIFAFEVKAYLDRGVTTINSELNIGGSKDSFCENININLGLIRKRIKNNLISSSLYIGKITNTKINVLYIDSICKSNLVNNVINKLNNINIDGIVDSSYLKQVFENNKVFPTVMITERPDNTVMALLEGKVIILVDNSPYALILPCFFFDFFHTTDDYYQKSFNTTFIRLIRLVAFLLAIFIPGIYLSVTTRNYNLIPTPLLLMLKAGRTFVPFPAYIEAIFMIICFEILRESDLRMSTTSGTAVSILGGLILGDAAVAAGIVSPIMIIVIAISSIAGLIFSSLELVNALRYYKILILILSIFLGIYGVILGLIILIYDILSIKTLNYKYFYIDKNDLDDLIIKKDNYIKKRKNILTNNIIRGKYK